MSIVTSLSRDSMITGKILSELFSKFNEKKNFKEKIHQRDLRIRILILVRTPQIRTMKVKDLQPRLCFALCKLMDQNNDNLWKLLFWSKTRLWDLILQRCWIFYFAQADLAGVSKMRFWRERERENKEPVVAPLCGQIRVLVVGDSGNNNKFSFPWMMLDYAVRYIFGNQFYANKEVMRSLKIQKLYGCGTY